jgi:dTDP-4-amino-4,6-dideoxygalactose transaminase
MKICTPSSISHSGKLPQAENMVKAVLSLRLYPELTTTEVSTVIDAILEFQVTH